VTTLFNKCLASCQHHSRGGHRVIGWFIARIVQRVVQSFLASVGVDRLSEKWGLARRSQTKLSGVFGLVVYFVILVPVLISALVGFSSTP